MPSGSRPRPVQMAAARQPETAGTFHIGRVFHRMLGVLGPNAVTLLALIALAAVPERALYHLAGDSKIADSLSRLALAFSGLLLQLAVIRLSFDRFADNRTSLGACVGQAFRSFFPVLAIGILAALPLALTLLLVIVPGVMLSLSWSAAMPVRIAEGAGIFACFKRSAELTRGHHWRILAVFLLLGLALAPVLLALQLIWGIPLSLHAMFFDRNWLSRLVFDAALGLVLAATYFELHAAEPAAPSA